ncbi:AMIN domain-containing protein, partial [Telluria sp. Tellsp99]
MTRFLSAAGGMLLALATVCAWAQDNAIESISANQQGGNVVIRVGMKAPPKQLPIGFSITNPARIALDFGATANATGKNVQDINLGDVRGVNVVQAGERTRLVLNLKRVLNYATAVDGKDVIVTVEGSGAPARAIDAAGAPVFMKSTRICEPTWRLDVTD